MRKLLIRLISTALLGAGVCVAAEAVPHVPYRAELTNVGSTTPWTCVKPPADVVLSRHQQQHKAEQECINRHLLDGLRYDVVPEHRISVGGRFIRTGTGLPVPSTSAIVPVAETNINCVVSWTDWIGDISGPIDPVTGEQLVNQYMDGTVTTEPQNNGAACPEDLHPTRTITVYHTPGGPAAPTLAATATENALTGLLIRAASPGPAPEAKDVGSFRVPCLYSHMLPDDHIVFPGQPGASHAHTFFGNTTTNGNSTDETLEAATSSTCAGGTANKSAYWVPSLIRRSTNTAIAPNNNAIWYYKSNYAADLSGVIPPPNGLRMIAGKSPTATGPMDGWSYERHVRFYCGAAGTPQETIPVGCGDLGLDLTMSLTFPDCWDGVNYDSPNHRSHVAYSNGYTCPSSHPVMMPILSLIIGYTVEAEEGVSDYRLSSDPSTGVAGYSMHGDVEFMWTESVSATFTTNCVKARMDCHAFLLGDGTELHR